MTYSRCGSILTLCSNYALNGPLTVNPGNVLVIPFPKANFGGPYTIDSDCSFGLFNLCFPDPELQPLISGCVGIEEVNANTGNLLFDLCGKGFTLSEGGTAKLCFLAHVKLME